MIQNRAEYIAYLYTLPVQPTTHRNYESWVGRIEEHLDTPLSARTIRNEDDVARIAQRVQDAGFSPSHLKDIRCIVRYYLKFLISYGVVIAQDQQEAAGAYEPKDPVGARVRVQTSIALRRGQAAFRNALLKVYESTCCVTGTKADGVLEAAHILSYAGGGTNELTNGMLLRSDIHVLFDLRLLSIHPKSWKVYCSPLIRDADPYKELHGRKVAFLPSGTNRPNPEWLSEHYSETAAN